MLFRSNEAGRLQLESGLENRGFEITGDKGNFILFSVPDSVAAAQAFQGEGVIVRPLAGYGLPKLVRVSIGTEAENNRFLEALSCIRT